MQDRTLKLHRKDIVLGVARAVEELGHVDLRDAVITGHVVAAFRAPVNDRVVRPAVPAVHAVRDLLVGTPRGASPAEADHLVPKRLAGRAVTAIPPGTNITAQAGGQGKQLTSRWADGSAPRLVRRAREQGAA